MADVDEDFLVHTITAERKQGQSSKGTLYSPVVTVHCFVNDRHTLTLDSEGREVTAEATITALLSDQDNLAVGTRVTLPDGRQRYVVSRQVNDDGGLGAPQNVVAAVR